jgi:hypothetical protein
MKKNKTNLEDLLESDLKLFEGFHNENKLIGEQKDMYYLIRDLTTIDFNVLSGINQVLNENYNLTLDYIKAFNEDILKINEIKNKYKLIKTKLKSIDKHIQTATEAETYFSNNMKDMLKISYTEFETAYQKCKEKENIDFRKTAIESGNLFLYLGDVSKRYKKKIFCQKRKITSVRLKINQLQKTMHEDYAMQETQIKEQKYKIELSEKNNKQIKKYLEEKDEEIKKIKQDLKKENNKICYTQNTNNHKNKQKIKTEKNLITFKEPNYYENCFDFEKYLESAPKPKQYSLNIITDILQGLKDNDLMVDRISKVSNLLTNYNPEILTENREYFDYIVKGIKKEITQGNLRRMMYENKELKKDIQDSFDKMNYIGLAKSHIT